VWLRERKRLGLGLNFNQKRALGRRCLFDIFYFHFTQKIEKIEAGRVTRTKKGGEVRRWLSVDSICIFPLKLAETLIESPQLFVHRKLFIRTVPYGLGYVVFHGGKYSEGSPPQSLGSSGTYSLTHPENPLKLPPKNPQTKLFTTRSQSFSQQTGA
jgi:hypothetical protein